MSFQLQQFDHPLGLIPHWEPRALTLADLEKIAIQKERQSIMAMNNTPQKIS
jgi:hypothetical protein